jgi:hypothetical protein
VVVQCRGAWWKSKRQPVVGLSTDRAEFIASSFFVPEVYARPLLEQTCITSISKTIPDASSGLAILFVVQILQSRLISKSSLCMMHKFCSSAVNTADLLTKQLTCGAATRAPRLAACRDLLCRDSRREWGWGGVGGCGHAESGTKENFQREWMRSMTSVDGFGSGIVQGGCS